MPVDPNQLFEMLKNLSLIDGLALLVGKGVFDYSGKGFSQIKKWVQDKYNEEKFLFVPDKKEADLLVSFKKSPSFREVLDLVPNYKYLDLIRTGMLIDYYHNNDSPENRERVQTIKLQILNRPNGKKQHKTVNLPATPFFTLILRHLYELKAKGYNESYLEETLEEMINDWDNSSLFAQSHDSETRILDFCTKQVEENKSPFFVLGMRSVADKVKKSTEKFSQSEMCQSKKYTRMLTERTEGNHPRVEVTFYKSEQ